MTTIKLSKVTNSVQQETINTIRPYLKIASCPTNVPFLVLTLIKDPALFSLLKASLMLSTGQVFYSGSLHLGLSEVFLMNKLWLCISGMKATEGKLCLPPWSKTYCYC